jgi:acetyl-CoA carboxylase carboxyl transferase subunit beta
LAWLNRDKAPLVKGDRKDTPDGVWEKCKQCQEVIYRKNFEANLYVCPKCQYHFPCPPVERLSRFCDPGTLTEVDISLKSLDPLQFSDTKPYKVRLAETQKKLGRLDAFVSCEGTLHGRPVQVGAFDFAFMGGSMGTVVGEKVSRLFLRSIKKNEPAIIFSSSGGARMQEGILSLMQMAKTCASLSELRSAGIPFISVLCHPTTGGVAASFSMLGDINIGEPQALIGFAGPRVIQQTIREELPKGFQRSEYLLEHGMLDMICERHQLRSQIADILEIIFPPESDSKSRFWRK